jgi:hypothetical protein
LWGWIVAGIGLCASCIGIFSFLTGWQTVPDIVNTAMPATSIYASLTPTLFLTPTPLATSTNQPETDNNTQPTIEINSTPEIIPFENVTTTIERSSGSTGFIIQILGGGKPLQKITRLDVARATQAISGEWTIDPSVVNSTTHELDVNGMVTDSVPPGDYIMFTSSETAWFDNLGGTWGIFGLGFSYEIQLIPFSVQSDKTTKVTISLAKLDVGVLSPDGHAVSNALVYIYCQGKDIAGNPIALEKSGCKNRFEKTDTTGLATFYVGAGTYIVEVAWGSPSTVRYDITVSPGENKTEIIQTVK